MAYCPCCKKRYYGKEEFCSKCGTQNLKQNKKEKNPFSEIFQSASMKIIEILIEDYLNTKTIRVFDISTLSELSKVHRHTIKNSVIPILLKHGLLKADESGSFKKYMLNIFSQLLINLLALYMVLK